MSDRQPWRIENPENVATAFDGAIEIAIRSKKLKVVTLVKWLSKRSVEKIQEEHRQAITGCHN